MEEAIRIEELHKSYGKIRAVRGVSLAINKGEIFGLIGPNGAGKTTILRMISTILSITSGNVRVFGFRLPGDESRVRKIISYLPEEAGAYRNLTGMGYLNFMASLHSLSNGGMEKLVTRGIEIANLGERISDKVSSYSKGMTRKLLVARALMASPMLAILDEPTSGLDVMNAREIRKVIRDFIDKDKVCICSSHNMLEVEFLCDRIALISDGLIVEEGNPAQLMKKHSADNIEEVFTKVV